MKKQLAFFLCIIMLLSLTACGGSAAPAGQTAAEAVGSQNETAAQAEKEAAADNEKSAAEAAAPGADAGKPSAETADPGAKPAAAGQTDAAIAALEQQYAALETDELTWEYQSATKTVVISGEGPMRDYLETAPEWDVYSSEAEHVVICDKVTSVGAGAFLYFSQITDVDLGNTVEFVGASAFDNCCCLQTVRFPEVLKYAGSYAFNNDLLHSENGFVFPEGMLYLGEGSFRSAFKDSYVSVPASLAAIEKGAFANCFVEEFRVAPENPAYASADGVLYDKGLTTVINYPADKRDEVYAIPETVTTILSEAIAVTNTLEKIVLPAGVTGIEEGAIFWNYALTDIQVDENNKNYRSAEGVLYTADGKLLLSYPIASDRTEYTIPEGCERIGDYAISQAANLTELHIGEGLKEIGNTALYLCSSLQKVGLPKSLQTIGDNAFGFCDALTEIRFAGSSAEWGNVEIQDRNERLTDGSVPVYCAE